MSPSHVPKSEQCFFKSCHSRGTVVIKFRDQHIRVCSLHEKTWGDCAENHMKLTFEL